MLKQEAQLP